MSQEIVTQVRSQFPTPLGASQPTFLIAVAKALGMGLFKKDSGSNVALPDGTKVSGDTVMNRAGDTWDILQDQENAANPVFNPSGHDDPTVHYYDVGGQTQPQTPPAPPGATNADAALSSFILDVRASLGRVETGIGQSLSNDAVLSGQITQLQAVVQQVGQDMLKAIATQPAASGSGSTGATVNGLHLQVDPQVVANIIGIAAQLFKR